jgi:hypothetical protein
MRRTLWVCKDHAAGEASLGRWRTLPSLQSERPQAFADGPHDGHGSRRPSAAGAYLSASSMRSIDWLMRLSDWSIRSSPAFICLIN